MANNSKMKDVLRVCKSFFWNTGFLKCKCCRISLIYNDIVILGVKLIILYGKAKHSLFFIFLMLEVFQVRSLPIEQ